MSARGPSSRTRAVLALCFVAYLLHAWFLGYAREDGFITFRFARNLANGHGFVWNVGEPPIEGFTTLLWVLVSAAAIRVGADVVLVTQALGLVSAVGILALVHRFARRHLGASSVAACVPVAFLAVSGPLATWGPSGMETSAFALAILFAVASFVTHLRGEGSSSVAPLVTCGVALFVATLLRPEGVMVAGVLAGLAFTVYLPRTRATLRATLAGALAYALPLAAYVVWRLGAFEDPLPNTFYQKTGGGYWQYVRGVGYVVFFALFFLVPLAPFPVLLAWERGYPGARTVLRPSEWLRLARANEGIAVCAVLTLVYFAYDVYVGGDYMPLYRFMVPVLPFLYLLLAPVTDGIREGIRGERHKERLFAALLVVALGGTLVHSTPLEESFFRKATWQMGNYRGVVLDRHYNARFAAIGEFFEQRRRSDDESLATRSIGLIGWHAEHLAIHDLSGLTDRHIAHVEARSTAQGWAGHEKWDLDYSFGRLPTYFLLDENLVEEDVAETARTAPLADVIERVFPSCRLTPWIREHPDFIAEHYEVRTAWVVDEVNGEEGYLAFLERR